jgi:hypothetical protein
MFLKRNLPRAFVAQQSVGEEVTRAKRVVADEPTIIKKKYGTPPTEYP